jgi:DNA-binding MurR/RpiR family transcriptional regulator
VPPLLKIRSERDQMSAIERRIADFLLENAHLLRDYSSQQLADALKISQSSVVKFSQKLGFKGYPDLKFSVGEAVARNTGGEATKTTRAAKRDSQSAPADSLWNSKARAEEETRLINTPDKLAAIADALDRAVKVFLIGSGDDGVAAQAFAMKLASVGMVAVHHTDPVLMAASISAAGKGDVLMMLCEHGQHHALNQLSRQFRERHGKVITVTRHTANALRAHADMSLLVSAHDERRHIEPLLYHSALQHVLDLLFVLVCEEGDSRLAKLEANQERTKHLVDP